MSSRADMAAETFGSGFNCSQAVFSSFSVDLGLDPATARKIACGLGAGMAETDLVCGAVTGGILAISLKYGKEKREDTAARDRTYALVKEFITRFRERNGTVMCTSLIGCNLSDPADLSKAKESGLFRTKCPKYVRDAVEIAEKFIR